MTIVTNAHMHHIDPSVTRRQKVEQRIASALVSSLLGLGYSLAVAQGAYPNASPLRLPPLQGGEESLIVWAPKKRCLNN